MSAVATPTRPGVRQALPAVAVRTDIQALRAMAVMGVLAYHLQPHRLTGGYVGVDVFFVISGYLITAHLVRRPPRCLADLLEFWSRRVRRLLPAALLVLLSVLIASRLLAPATQWANTATQTRAAGLYVVNWRLAADAVDYLNATKSPTPVQHYWSLSIEEQFYLVWPVLILLLAALARRLRRPVWQFVFSGLAALVLASLWYSIEQTAQEPARAYFVTTTRVWELGIGGLLAAAQTRDSRRHRHVPRLLAGPGPSLVAWGGFACIAFAMLAFDDMTPWPGWHALVPTLGCAAVIAANNPRGRFGPAGLLALRPVQWVGDISYSLYLWHWPLIVVLPYLSGRLGVLGDCAVLAFSLALAAATKRFVEDPFRRPTLGRSVFPTFGLAAVGMIVVVGVANLQITAVRHHDAQEQAAAQAKVESSDPCLGAPALTAGPRKCPPVTSGTLTPDVESAADDQTPGYSHQPGVRSCFATGPAYHPATCTYGPEDAGTRIAVVGNSHVFQFISAIAPIAEALHWHVTTYVAESCALNDATQRPHPVAGDSAGCSRWVHWATRQVTRGEFDLVITAARLQVGRDGLSYSPSQQQYTAGYVSVLRKLRSAGERVIAIRDSPSPTYSIPDCLESHRIDYTACDGPRAVWMPADPLVTAVRQLHDPDVTTLDLADHLCGPAKCPAVIGGVAVYFDNSHLSATFARTLAPYIEQVMDRAVRS